MLSLSLPPSTFVLSHSCFPTYLLSPCSLFPQLSCPIPVSPLASKWDWALSLAKQHELPEVSGLLTQYAANLLSGGKVLNSIELYRKANRFVDAAQLLVEV